MKLVRTKKMELVVMERKQNLALNLIKKDVLKINQNALNLKRKIVLNLQIKNPVVNLNQNVLNQIRKVVLNLKIKNPVVKKENRTLIILTL